MPGDGSARRVAVIGGGVSGLSAAHELALRDFKVTVFERRNVVGGKAVSWAAQSGLPGEHGFRFFPGFYYHVVETMKSIPVDGGLRSVAERLIELDTAIFADSHGRRMTTPLPTTQNPHPRLTDRLKGMWSFRKAMPTPWEGLVFLCILARLVTTCEDRWNEELEQRSWLEQVMPSSARQRSENYRRLCAIGLTRSFVATRAEEMNARTGGKILLQLLYDSYFGPPIRRAPDRALNGPTTKVWIEPWQTMLRDKGVQFEQCRQVVGLDVVDGRISAIRWQPTPPDDLDDTETAPAEAETAPADTPPASAKPQPEPCPKPPADAKATPTDPEDFDWYVLAVPAEVMKQILVKSPQVMRADPALDRVFQLKTRWMNGIVCGLPGKLNPPLPKGHVLCLDSQWALTLVDQTAFWSDEHLKDLTPQWPTLLSVDVSDWDTPGIKQVPAKWTSTQNELVANLWQQLCDHLPELPSLAPTDCNVDTNLHYGNVNPGSIAVKRTNDEPLLINTPGSWANRPKARTRIPNLFVAGDFARTFTNFASMEAANEAARRAVNELLREAGIDDRCEVRNLEDPDVPWFKLPADVARAVDTVFYALGLPLRPPFRLPIAAWITLGTITKLKRPLDRVTSGVVPRRFR
jgi:uncharacterized protein with NAD-binding domain and iron-sulfur cluster